MSPLTLSPYCCTTPRLGLPREGRQRGGRVPHFSLSSGVHHRPLLLHVLVFTSLWSTALFFAIPLSQLVLQEVLKGKLLIPVQVIARLKHRKEKREGWNKVQIKRIAMRDARETAWIPQNKIQLEVIRLKFSRDGWKTKCYDLQNRHPDKKN